jgi:hypothetical protein
MLEEFWTGLGDKLAERWLALLFSPALAFWTGGLAALAWRYLRMPVQQHGWHHVLAGWQPTIGGLPVIVQGALVVSLLTGITLSAVVVQWLSFPALRLLAGDWPPWLLSISAPIQRARLRRIANDREQLRAYAARNKATLTARERRKYHELDRRYVQTPADPSRQTVTRLGNALRAYEGRPIAHYGLDAAVCWPHLWLLLPDTVRQDVAQARIRLNSATQTCLWGILFTGWTALAYWALPVGLLISIFGYRRAFAASISYGKLFAASFDVHRNLLYHALRWPLPDSPAHEWRSGSELTHYLHYGSRSTKPLFLLGRNTSPD